MGNSGSKSPLPGAGEGKRGEQGRLGYLLRQAAAAHRLRMERALADLGVTPPQFSVLTILAAYPGYSNADIARVTLLTPQTVCVIVANLERMGAITRTPHAVHGRIKQIELSKSGRALLASCKTRVHALDRDLSGELSPADERAIRRWLVKAATSEPGT